MYEPDTLRALALIDYFKEIHAGRALLLDYLERGYFKDGKKERWMLCYRQDISTPAIDTNNHVESWHNSLKTHFFKDKRKRRPDAVVYTMVKSVIPFYQLKLYSSTLDVGRMNPIQRSERDAKIRAESYIRMQRSLGYSGQFVFGTEERSVLQVRSFKDDLLVDPASMAKTFYNIRLDFSTNTLLGTIAACSCPFFRLKKTCCKHISLVEIDKEPIEFARNAAVWEQVEEMPCDPPKVEVKDEFVKVPATSRAKIRRHTKGFLNEVEGIFSATQIAEDDRDLVDYMQEVYDKLHSMGLTHKLEIKRERQNSRKK